MHINQSHKTSKQYTHIITHLLKNTYGFQLYHYNDVIMSVMAHQITSLTIFYSSVYSGTDENIKAPRHWPLCGEFTGDRWIPRRNGQKRGKCFHLITSSWFFKLLATFYAYREILNMSIIRNHKLHRSTLCHANYSMMTSSNGTLSALLALCVGNLPVNSPHKGHVELWCFMWSAHE